MTTDPKTDIQESNWTDVTSSSYVEQDRLNADLDDLAGNFTPSTKVANNAVNDTLGGSKMAAMGAGLMTDYLLRTIIETWWEPTLRHLVLLEQYYETDQVVLGVCAKKARLFPRYGISEITDDLLNQEVNVSVNVGMGSANPNERMAKFLSATSAAVQLVSTAPPGLNVQESIKEIYSNAGYRDGARFWSEQADPRLLKAMQVIEQMKGMLEGKQMELAAENQVKGAQIASNERIKGAEIQVNAGRIAGELRIKETQNAIDAASVQMDGFIAQLEAAGIQQEQMGAALEIQARLKEARMKLVEAGLKVQGQALKLIEQKRESQRAAQSA